MSGFERVLFWLLLLTALGISTSRLLTYVKHILKGKGTVPTDRPVIRIKTALTQVVGQWSNLKTASINDLAGPGHLLIFWGAILLSLYYVFFVFIGEGLGLSEVVRSNAAARVLLTLTDVFTPLLAIGMLAAALRRSITRPMRLGPDFDVKLFWALTGACLLLICCYWAYESLRIYIGLSQAGPFLTDFLAKGWHWVHLNDAQAVFLFQKVFWVQFFLLLSVMVYAANSNHRHPFFSPFNIFFRSFSSTGTIPLVDFSKEEKFGAARPGELTKVQLLNGFACTHCGRCQASCPAYATDKPLSPKQLLLDINHQLLSNGFGSPPPVQSDRPSGIAMETLLSCTTCGACIEVCPVLNRPLDSLLSLRRHLVYEGIFEPGHATTLKRISQDANPWGMRWHRRAQHFELPVAKPEVHYDYIYWLGCAAAFDDRARRIAEAMAVILKRAGISVAILGIAEKCCGDAARRIGDEGLFQNLAMENVRLLTNYDFDAVLTHCPHCFNSLKNDYAPLGANFKVIHHSNLLRDLIHSKQIELHPAKGHFVYHDPCYLGRYNQTYRAPRNILGSITQNTSEFDHNQSDSFCCGAGGGHMWKTTETGQRISVVRVKQALAKSPDTITSACPYCLLMFEEAIQTVAPPTPVKVYDIAEIVQMNLK